jgi:trehalose 6-phosphate phosphatase
MAQLSPVTRAGQLGLAALRADPAAAVVGLDFDGTLAPIVADPSAARAHPGALPALARLAPALDSVVVITGRPALVAVEYGGFRGAPGLDHLVVLGQYGLERWEAATDELTRPEPSPGVLAARAALPKLLAAADAPPGVAVEDKRLALAVHTRRAADPVAALDKVREPLAGLAAANGLVVEPGRHVLELRPPGVDKGGALDGYLAERAAARTVLYAGDDLGDLAAFDAVDRARARGLAGLTVCSGSAEVSRLAERADLVVDGPDGVVDLLAGLAEAIGR